MHRQNRDMNILDPAVGMNCAELYGEYQVVNKTRQPVGVITRAGERFVLESTQYAELNNPHVVINSRRSCGTNRDIGGVRQAPIQGTEIIVPEFDFMNSTVHIEEIDILLCPASMVDIVSHPAEKADYTKTLKSNLESMVRDDIPTTLRIFANDPSGKLKEVKWQFMGKEISVPVTASDTSEAEIIFIVSSNKKIELTMHIPLDDLPTDGYIEWKNGFVLHLAVNSGQLKCGLEKKAADSERPVQDYDDLLRQNTKKVTDTLNHKHDLEKADLEEKIRKLRRTADDEKHKVDNNDRKIQELETLITNYKAILETGGEDAKRKHEQTTMSVKEEELKTKLKESEAKQQRAERQSEAERWRGAISVATAVVSTVATITVLFMKKSK